MHRGSALLLLGVVGIGAFLSGLELMITAVALPAIVVDLADWTELRAASWIINGYLLVSIVVMPIAGQLVDRHGVRRVFLAALLVFIAGSALAGAAGSLGLLIAARLLQAVGGGALVPVATAAAPLLFAGAGGPRALGLVGGLTFLGMAAGPFAGSWVLQAIHPGATLDGLGVEGGARAALESPWRYVFYLNVPLGLATLALGGAATSGWMTPRREHRLDIAGAALASIGLGALLLGVTLAGSEPIPGLAIEPNVLAAALGLTAFVAFALAVGLGRRREEPFIDTRWFRAPAFASAALVSLLTGYGFATAIIGGAVFVDRVLYGGPDAQRVALGALAGATAAGALVSGFVLRALGLRLTTLAGLAALTAFGSTIIDQLWASIRATPDAYKAFIPEALRNRPFNDGLVVDALESWASGEAARILVGVFLVAAAIMAIAVLPTLTMNRPAAEQVAGGRAPS